MGRELRRVPPDWNHPKRDDGRQGYQPLYDHPFKQAASEWKKAFFEWEAGERPDYCSEESKSMEYWEWSGDPPDPKYYRPDWPEESRTHFQMYESTSEGTPISPVFADVESLCHWLADNNASAFAGQTATYEQWLAMCDIGYSFSALMTPKGMISGVAACSLNPAAAAAGKE